MRKKILPVLLALAMVLGMLPMSVFAADVTVDANGVAAVSDADGLKSALTTQGATTIQLSGDIKGAPEITGENSFTDVAADAYYANAIQWAVSNGVTSGTSATTFSPDAQCTRAQIVTFLYHAFAE